MQDVTLGCSKNWDNLHLRHDYFSLSPFSSVCIALYPGLHVNYFIEWRNSASQVPLVASTPACCFLDFLLAFFLFGGGIAWLPQPSRPYFVYMPGSVRRTAVSFYFSWHSTRTVINLHQGRSIFVVFHTITLSCFWTLLNHFLDPVISC